jgi:hypothetical protein
MDLEDSFGADAMMFVLWLFGLYTYLCLLILGQGELWYSRSSAGCPSSSYSLSPFLLHHGIGWHNCYWVGAYTFCLSWCKLLRVCKLLQQVLTSDVRLPSSMGLCVGQVIWFAVLQIVYIVSNHLYVICQLNLSSTPSLSVSPSSLSLLNLSSQSSRLQQEYLEGGMLKRWWLKPKSNSKVPGQNITAKVHY